MEISLSWNLALLFFLFGLSLQAAAALLVLGLGTARLPHAHRLGQAAALLIFLGIALQVISLLVPPERVVESYWFVLAVAPLLLPALLIPLAPPAARETAPSTAPPATDSPSAFQAASPMEEREKPPTEFQRYLEEIPAVLAEHPEGLTLVEIGRELNVEWRKLTGAARELLDRGLVRKEEKRYFLVKGPEA